jgi:hypothetical protein
MENIIHIFVLYFDEILAVLTGHSGTE